MVPLCPGEDRRWSRCVQDTDARVQQTGKGLWHCDELGAARDSVKTEYWDTIITIGHPLTNCPPPRARTLRAQVQKFTPLTLQTFKKENT